MSATRAAHKGHQTLVFGRKEGVKSGGARVEQKHRRYHRDYKIQLNIDEEPRSARQQKNE